MYYDIKPNSKLGKRLQSIANWYRNNADGNNRISKYGSDDRRVRVTVSKNNLLGLTYSGPLVKGKIIGVEIAYGRVSANMYGQECILKDCNESQARNYLTKLLDKYFSHIPEKVKLNPVMRA